MAVAGCGESIGTGRNHNHARDLEGTVHCRTKQDGNRHSLQNKAGESYAQCAHSTHRGAEKNPARSSTAGVNARLACLPFCAQRLVFRA